MIAVGHSILTSVWHVLHDNVSYNELGAEYLTKRIALKRKEYLERELKGLGYEVTLSKVIA